MPKPDDWTSADAHSPTTQKLLRFLGARAQEAHKRLASPTCPARTDDQLRGQILEDEMLCEALKA